MISDTSSDTSSPEPGRIGSTTAPTTPHAVIFDLDGTVVDPAGAITGGIAAALRAHGIAVPPQPVLDAMVGPPLATSLLAVPGVTEDVLPRVVEHYRRGYLAHGMAESQVYPGIRDLLDDLREAGSLLAIATSKPQPLAERLVHVQGLTAQFDAICGSSPDEAVPHAGKGPIIGAALQSLGLQPDHPGVVMVGDRLFDVEGARLNGLPCVGVRWGYAPEEELEAAGAARIVEDAADLRAALGERLPAPWRLTDSRP